MIETYIHHVKTLFADPKVVLISGVVLILINRIGNNGILFLVEVLGWGLIAFSVIKIFNLG